MEKPATAATTDNPASSSSSTAAKTSQTPAEVAAESSKESTAQETFIFRDQSPTLKKGQIEASLDLGYVHSSGFLQIDRVATQAVSLRYGIMDGLEIAASLPHYDSVRSTSTTPGETYEGKVDTFGSSTLGLSYSLFNQTPDWVRVWPSRSPASLRAAPRPTAPTTRNSRWGRTRPTSCVRCRTAAIGPSAPTWSPTRSSIRC